jgi:aspartyl-tRNA(Asn)/glutamyl-tRNA(Gln) amidotransferase subunit B
MHISQLSFGGNRLAELIALVDSGKVSFSVASQKIFPQMVQHKDLSALAIAERDNLIQESNTDTLLVVVKEVVAKYPEKVAEYRGGKVGLLGMFMGEVMKASKGKADPKVTTELLKKELEQN